MKKVKALIMSCLILWVIMTASLSLAAAGSIEDKIIFGEDEILHKMSIFIAGQLEDSEFGWSAYFLSHKYWSEALIGPTWAPASWINLSVSIGVQSVDSGSPAYFGASLWVGGSAGSVLALYERGAKASNDWWKVVPVIALPNGIKAGAILEKGLDAAPMLAVDIPKMPLNIWGAWYKDAPQLGIKFKF